MSENRPGEAYADRVLEAVEACDRSVVHVGHLDIEGVPPSIVGSALAALADRGELEVYQRNTNRTTYVAPGSPLYGGEQA